MKMYAVVQRWESRSRHAVDGYAYGGWSKFFMDKPSADKEMSRLLKLEEKMNVGIEFNIAEVEI